ncbi:MAG: hypothetical protein RR185_07795 [Angelakisella sp.]
MAELFKLPASSYEEIVKIIKAYANEKEGVLLSLDDIAQATGMPRTVVSANNGFLVQAGVTTEGNKKTATDTGRALGRAYISKVEDEISRIWKEVIVEIEFLNRMLSAVRIRSGMDRTSFLNHIVYSSGQKDTKANRAGAAALIEIFKSINLLVENDGKLTVTESQIEPQVIVEDKHDTRKINTYAEAMVETTAVLQRGNIVNINLNIACNVSELDEVGVKLKKLLTQIKND